MNIFKSKVFKIIMPVIFIVLVLLLYICGYCFPKLHRHYHALDFASDVLEAYIDKNEGNMPESEEVLIKHGFLRKKAISDKTIYEGRTNTNKAWFELPNFEKLMIHYNIKLSSICIRDGKMINIDSGDPLLIINGPPAPWPFRSAYKSYSRNLYDYMSTYHD